MILNIYKKAFSNSASIVLWFLAILLHSSAAFAAIRPDSLPKGINAKFLKPVKIGPQAYYLPPPIDSALLRKQFLDAWYAKKYDRDIGIINNELRKHIISQTEDLPVYNLQANMTEAALINLLSASRLAANAADQILILNSLIFYHAKSGNDTKLAFYLNESLKFKEVLGDKTGLANVSLLLAQVYTLLKNYNQALNFYDYNIKINTQLKKALPIADAHIQTAYVKTLQHRYVEAETILLKKALPLSRRMGYKFGRMKSFEYSGFSYLQQSRLTEAKWYYLQAVNTAEILQNTPAKIASLINLGKVKIALTDYDLARQDFKLAHSLANQYAYPEMLPLIKTAMAELFYKQGNYLAAENLINNPATDVSFLFNTSKSNK